MGSDLCLSKALKLTINWIYSLKTILFCLYFHKFMDLYFIQNRLLKNHGENRIHAPVQRVSRFRFYEELNDFLPEEWRKVSFPYGFTGTPSVKNIIEAIGVPHAGIDIILVDGVSVGFDHILRGGEQVSVYPAFESFDISPLVKLRAKPLRLTRFVVDVNLGKLARKLRLLGFDTLFRNDYGDDEIVADAVREKRIILTRDIGVLKHGAVTHGYWLRSEDPKKQVTEVMERFQLQNSIRPFSRCSNCNGKLVTIDKEAVESRLQPDTFAAFDTFWQCGSCKNIYWKGSHYDRICEWVERLNPS
jgi:uncharacterized protein with PIN domain